MASQLYAFIMLIMMAVVILVLMWIIVWKMNPDLFHLEILMEIQKKILLWLPILMEQLTFY